MIKSTQLATLVALSVVLWVASLAGVPYFGLQALPSGEIGVLMGVIALAALASLLTLHQSQRRADHAFKELSRVRRSLQEGHLEIERHEYESKQGTELRRLALTSAQEKDLALQNMASALNTAMAEVISLSDSPAPDAMARVRQKAELMQRYADDLKTLAKLELKSELPRHDEVNFLAVIESFVDEWNRYGKSRQVKVKLEHQEDQLPLVSDVNWLHNLLTRSVQALIRMNEKTRVVVHLIGYIDAERGEALRITLTAKGRRLDSEQLATVLTHYTSLVDKGTDVGPGLSFVVARRLAQMLRGHLEVNGTDDGTEVVIVLPRRLGGGYAETVLED